MKTFALYRMFDQEGTLLYVGKTTRPSRRIGEHRASKDWWPEVASVTVEHLGTDEELAAAEFEAIQKENPKYNIALTALKGARVKVCLGCGRRYQKSEFGLVCDQCYENVQELKQIIHDAYQFTPEETSPEDMEGLTGPFLMIEIDRRLALFARYKDEIEEMIRSRKGSS